MLNICVTEEEENNLFCPDLISDEFLENLSTVMFSIYTVQYSATNSQIRNSRATKPHL